MGIGFQPKAFLALKSLKVSEDCILYNLFELIRKSLPNLSPKIAKILETQLTISVAKDIAGMIPVIGGMLGNIAGAGIGGKALYDLNQAPEETKAQPPKLAEGGSVLQEGIAKVDKNEIFLGKNSSEVFKDMYVSLNKISDNTTNKLSATSTLNKTDLTSS